MHPAIEHILKYFRYEHLPERLQEVSKPFADLAKVVASQSPDNPETTVALRKLLEAKDAAVRAALSVIAFFYLAGLAYGAGRLPQAPPVRVFKPAQAPLVKEFKKAPTKPAKEAEQCDCSPACTCGCQDGLPCRCGRPATSENSHQSRYTPPPSYSFPLVGGGIRGGGCSS